MHLCFHSPVTGLPRITLLHDITPFLSLLASRKGLLDFPDHSFSHTYFTDSPFLFLMSTARSFRPPYSCDHNHPSAEFYYHSVSQVLIPAAEASRCILSMISLLFTLLSQYFST